MSLTSVFPPPAARQRWATLLVVCLAQLMIVLDVTIVNVALPSIQHDLHFSQADLTWVVSAFLITFGSLLLLAGRLGDLLGRKRVFLAGVVLFTGASMLCGVASSQGLLIGARFLQGVGAAAQASVILAIIVTEFPEPAERARAMSAYVFVSVAGGSLGLLAGGLLTQALNWHWVFFVNVPIGLATLVLGRLIIPADRGLGLGHGVDWLGSLLVTSSLMSAIYAIVGATAHGWISAQVLGFAGLATVLMAAFLALEARIANPIMPLRILAVARDGVGQPDQGPARDRHVLHLLPRHAVPRARSPLQRRADWARRSCRGRSRSRSSRAGSRPGSSTASVRCGARRRDGSAIVGLLLFSTSGPDTAFFPTIFFACFAIGFGIGNAFMPLLTIAMADVPRADAGLGSGITNVSQQVSGALGLTVLGTLATDHTQGAARPAPRASRAR